MRHSAGKRLDPVDPVITALLAEAADRAYDAGVKREGLGGVDGGVVSWNASGGGAIQALARFPGDGSHLAGEAIAPQGACRR